MSSETLKAEEYWKSWHDLGSKWNVVCEFVRSFKEIGFLFSSLICNWVFEVLNTWRSGSICIGNSSCKFRSKKINFQKVSNLDWWNIGDRWSWPCYLLFFWQNKAKCFNFSNSNKFCHHSNLCPCFIMPSILCSDSE